MAIECVRARLDGGPRVFGVLFAEENVVGFRCTQEDEHSDCLTIITYEVVDIHHGEDVNIDPGFLVRFAPESLARILSWFEPTAGQVPHAGRMRIVGPALDDEEPFILDDECLYRDAKVYVIARSLGVMNVSVRSSERSEPI